MSRVVNPYNFVPFPDKAPERVSPEETYRDTASLLHGYLDVKLTNTSPLIILASEPWKTDHNDHKYYRFFRLPDDQKTPAIPGSEIRGLIRNIYETISNSCTTVLLDHNDYSMRTPPSGSFKKKGLLEYNVDLKKWYLYASPDIAIRLDENGYKYDLLQQNMVYKGKYHNGQKVLYTGNERNISLVDPASGSSSGRPGWLLFNKPVQGPSSYGRTKHYRLNIVEKTGAPLKVWDEKVNADGDVTESSPFRMLEDILTSKSSSRTTAHKDYLSALKKVHREGGCIPVWYLAVKRGNETLYYLSNASIGRVHMNRTWKDVMGSHSPCEKYDALCPACRLFGSVADEGFKSRVRFTDALPVAPIPQEDFGTRTLGILSTPRPSAFEFYIRKPEDQKVQYWNYDYYGTSTFEGLRYKDIPEASPRGRKFYWHGAVNPKDEEKSNQNSTMEFLKEGHAFSFRIYFDGITKKQLSDLEYAVTMGENTENGDLQLKIGHARPLGYGSVKLTIKEQVLRKVQRDGEKIQVGIEKTAVPATIADPADADRAALVSLKVMCSRKKTEGKMVAYPVWSKKPGASATIFDWFSNNRTNRGGFKTLPEPLPGNQDITVEAHNGENPQSIQQPFRNNNYGQRNQSGGFNNNYGQRNQSGGFNRGYGDRSNNWKGNKR